jgi:hypothetical protein
LSMESRVIAVLFTSSTPVFIDPMRARFPAL